MNFGVSFESFIEKKNLNLTDLDAPVTRINLFYEWSGRLLMELLFLKGLLPEGMVKTLKVAFEAVGTIVSQAQGRQLFLDQLAVSYAFISDFIIKNLQVRSQTIMLPIPGGYPFPRSKLEGVHFNGALYFEGGSSLHPVFSQTEVSFEGADSDSQLKMVKDVKKGIGKITWLVSYLESQGLPNVRDAFDLNAPHAELVWFVRHSQKLLQEIESQVYFEYTLGGSVQDRAKKRIRKLPILDDNYTHFQIQTFPRIQFVSSTVCCHQCRILFSAFRQELISLEQKIASKINQKVTIPLPIIVYTDSPYNTEEGQAERDGLIFVIRKNGAFHNTQFQCDSPRVCKSKPKVTSLVTQEDIDLIKLSLFEELVLLPVINTNERCILFFFPKLFPVVVDSKYPDISEKLLQAKEDMLQIMLFCHSISHKKLVKDWKFRVSMDRMNSLGLVDFDLRAIEASNMPRQNRSFLRHGFSSQSSFFKEINSFSRSLRGSVDKINKYFQLIENGNQEGKVFFSRPSK